MPLPKPDPESDASHKFHLPLQSAAENLVSCVRREKRAFTESAVVDTVEIPALNERQLARLGSASRESIAFDDLGNAVWQFAPDEGNQVDAAARPVRLLDHPALSLVEDEPPASETIRTNLKGLQTGYNPYDSGQLARKAARKPRDMRELSKWIELRKKLDSDK